MNIQIGSVISGTLRSQDLLPAFLQLAIEMRCYTASEHVEAETLLVNLSTYDDEDWYWDSGVCEFDLEDAGDKLNDIAPPYVYFGAHPDDGADFGFWVLWESIEEDKDSGELKTLDEVDTQSRVCVHEDKTGTLMYEVKVEYNLLWSTGG